MTQSTTMQVEQIALKQIKISDNNPRKHFSEPAIQELADSIIENGLINPITIRPLHGSGTFELVAGERRYRAHEVAGLEKIDVNIREMTDDEAFDIMVVENLQREQVHPMDEAAGFQKMLETGRYSIEEIANRIGKSDAFVRQRLQMNDLIEPLKDVFYEEELKIGHTMALSRLPVPIQEELYEGYFADPESHSYMPTVDSLKSSIARTYMLDLEEALFDTEDAELFPEAGPCTTCPKRTANSPSLFPEMQEEDRCTDKACYEMKQRLHKIGLIDRYKDNPDYYFLQDSWRDPKDFMAEKIKNTGVKVLMEGKDFKTLREEKKSGLKGIWISGWHTGKVVSIELKLTKKDKKEELSPAEYARTEIARIEELGTRKVELDREKIFKKIIPKMEEHSEFKYGVHTDGHLKQLAICWIVYEELTWAMQEKIHLQWGIGKDDVEENHISYGRTDMSHVEILDWLGGLPTNELKDKVSEVISYWLLSHCASESEADYGKWVHPYLMKKFAERYIPEDVKDFEAIQAEKAEAREQRYNERIKEHRQILQELGEADSDKSALELLDDYAETNDIGPGKQIDAIFNSVGEDNLHFNDLSEGQADQVVAYLREKGKLN